MIRIRSLIFPIVLIAATAAHADLIFGPSTSGGGVGVYCSLPTGNKLTLLEFFELRQSGRQTFASSGDAAVDYWKANLRARSLVLDRRPATAADVERVRKLFGQVHFQTDALISTVDFGSVKLPDGCSIRQIAVYDDAHGVLNVDRTLWDILPAIDRAGLLMHEQMYRMQRLAFYGDSSRARQFVAELFASDGPRFLGAYDGMTPGKALMCHAGILGTSTSIVFLWQGHTIQPVILAGEYRAVKTTVEVPISPDDVQLSPEANGPKQTVMRVISAPQSASISGLHFTSQLTIDHITWRQEVAKGGLFRVGFDVLQTTVMVPVNDCSTFRLE